MPPTPPGFEELPVEITPIYVTEKVNEPILLHEGNPELVQADMVAAGPGRITLNWLPRPELHFSIEYTSTKGRLSLSGGELRGPALEGQIKAFVYSANLLSLPGQDNHVSGTIEGYETGDGALLKRILFHVPNFCEFRGAPIRTADVKSVRAGRCVVCAEEWQITLDNLRAEDRFFKELKNTRGYAITHIGTVERRVRHASSRRTRRRCLTRFSGFCPLSAVHGRGRYSMQASMMLAPVVGRSGRTAR